MIFGANMNISKAFLVSLGVAFGCVVVIAGAVAQQTNNNRAITTDFQTPSGNIICSLDPAQQHQEAFLRCDVFKGSSTPPSQPKDCELDWGWVFGMGERGTSLRLCHGDTLFNPTVPVLAYGTRWAQAGFVCEVTTQRLRCTNRNGHGFELARARQVLF
jgi:hypothetical protein